MTRPDGRQGAERQQCHLTGLLSLSIRKTARLSPSFKSGPCETVSLPVPGLAEKDEPRIPAGPGGVARELQKQISDDRQLARTVLQQGGIIMMSTGAILFVDDEDSVIRFLRRAFATESHQILTATSAPAALRLMEQHPVSLVLVDQRMPGMSGMEMLREVQARWPDCARLILSGDPDIEAMIEAINDGRVHRFLTKPFELDNLTRIVRETVELFESGWETRHWPETLHGRHPEPRLGYPEPDHRPGVRAPHLLEKNAELEALRDRFLDLYNNAPDGYCSFLPDGWIVEANETQLRRLGYTHDEVVTGMRLTDFFPPEEAGKFPVLIEELTTRGEYSFETLQLRRDRTAVETRVSCRAVRDQSGGITLCHATLRDISEEKQLRDQLIQARKIESVGQLAGGIAHDFNNLLTGILGFTGFAMRQVGEDHPAWQSLEEVERAAQRASTLVAQLLAYSRQQISCPEPVDLNSLIGETAVFLRETLPETVDLTVSLGDQVSTVIADQAQIRQVLLNLCDNASQAMGGRGKLTITTGNAILDEQFVRHNLGSKPGAYSCFSVEDAGCGMSEEARRRVFEPFFNGGGKGAGLGLSMVYGVVKSHDGYITVRSEAGIGSCFVVYLPASGAGLRKKIEPQAQAMGGNATILFVDDEPVVASLACQVLAGYGFEILTAASGTEAVEIYRHRAGEIDLVISDVVMPGMGGTALCQELMRLNPEARIILST